MARPALPRRVIESPWLTAEEAAAYLRFASARALYKAIPVDGIPCARRGNKTLLFHRVVLDHWLTGARGVALDRISDRLIRGEAA